MYFEYGKKEIDHLSKKCKKLGAAIARIGAIERAINPDLFGALVESIIGQQISAKAAATVCGRMRDIGGMDMGILHGLPIEQIQACGMSLRKAGYIKGIADAAHSGDIDFAAIAGMDDADIIKALSALHGVGIWTAEMLLIFSLSRPNVISYGDLAIRRGIMNLYGHKELNRERFNRYAARYAPYASVASLYLWELSHVHSL